MKNSVYIFFGGVIITLYFVSSCASPKINRECIIKDMSNVMSYNDSTYTIKIMFNDRTTEEQRKNTVLYMLSDNYPHLTEKICYCEEHPGKRFNEYWYKFKTIDSHTTHYQSNHIESLSEETPNDIIYCLTEVGKDTLPTLNECESKCLNYEYQDRKGDFDFSGKKIAFFRGNTGRIRVSKEWYFRQLKETVEIYGYVPVKSLSIQLVIFNEKEAKMAGYDAVLFCASKKYISKKEAIDRLKKK